MVLALSSIAVLFNVFEKISSLYKENENESYKNKQNNFSNVSRDTLWMSNYLCLLKRKQKANEVCLSLLIFLVAISNQFILPIKASRIFYLSSKEPLYQDNVTIRSIIC